MEDDSAISELCVSRIDVLYRSFNVHISFERIHTLHIQSHREALIIFHSRDTTCVHSERRRNKISFSNVFSHNKKIK